ncbi:DNA-binding Lrp family transcriptional regulator [Brevibacterium sanguinis]|uniref:DNA-binding Lrp family transcriptional regulator n=3 Tax=Brevibacteriaceae TaxID=85019 RepID=A0A366IN14_9MICO|nr:DNA-binding Lrp family transcriptional regulator [Brevibacterium sanguinis]RBP72739.1 DNA-binding Lrp family transcriptional regulator [Brevibacterium celere]
MNERTVARKGQDLLSRGVVRVSVVSVGARGSLVEVVAERGAMRMAAKYLAARQEVLWLHMTTGPQDLLGEVNVPDWELADVVIDELQAVPGTQAVRTYPILDYLRLAKDWDPGLLSAEERTALDEQNEFRTPFYEMGFDAPALDPMDRRIGEELARNGRATFVDLGRAAGVSESTVRRRVARLVSTGRIAFRAVFDPKHLGLPLTAVLKLSVAPVHLTSVCAAVAGDSRIRNALVLTGSAAVLVQVDVTTRRDLLDLLATHPMMEHVGSVETSVVLQSAKRSRTQFDV